MNWLREAISDDCDRADMAYVVIGMLAVFACGSICFLFWMAAIDYHACAPTISISTGATDTRHITPCRFDPLPLGQAAGLIFGAFASLIISLSTYMFANRRQPRPPVLTDVVQKGDK